MKKLIQIQKKGFALLLCLTLVMSIVGCSKKEEESDEGNKTVSTATWEAGELTAEHSGLAKDADVILNKVEGMPENFIKAMDISSLISLEQAGVTYHDANGNEADLLKVLSEAGYNYVRIRIWNNPYNSKGNGYGGGNCDIEKAKQIGKRAAQYGIKVIVDFHYSDFWCDPDKQQVPKAWSEYNYEGKKSAMASYTEDALNELIDAGVDVGMVQIGNETNGVFCGETNWINICELFNVAAGAIRTVDPDILIALHFSDPERAASFENYLMILENYEVDYDVFATSYYSYYHGSLENLTNVLKMAIEDYGKYAMVMETSYAYCSKNFDGWENTIGDGSPYTKNYSYTVQGQATSVRDVVEAVVNAGGIGVCYWEGAWVGVKGDDTYSASEKWEVYGCGWASSYAGEYDLEDAALWYGGCAVENQALFYVDETSETADAYPLDSLNVFEYCYTGATSDVVVDIVNNTSVTVRLGDDIILPDTVVTEYNDGSTENWKVEWNEISDSAMNAMQNGGAATYSVKGKVYNKDGNIYTYVDNSGNEREYTVSCSIKMVEPNYVDNHSFEEQDTSMWVFDDKSADDPEHELYVMDRVSDAYDGNYSLHWYSLNYVEFTVSQTITGLKPGKYKMSAFIQGGDSTNQTMYIFCKTSNDVYTQDMKVTEWRVFDYSPTIDEIVVPSDGTVEIGAYIYAEADEGEGPWGTIDYFLFNPIDGAE